MTNDFTPVFIRFADEFEKNLYRLSKKYRNIRADVQPIIQQIQAGNLLDDRLSSLDSDNFIYKLRIKNSNIRKGKSGSYRLIYLVESETSVLLLTIYSKSEQEDLTVNAIKSIVDEFY